MPRPRRAMSEINVVPYIDVMLVLLVIFMITAPLVNPGVIELPSVGKSSQPPELPLEVVIKADASLVLRERIQLLQWGCIAAVLAGMYLCTS